MDESGRAAGDPQVALLEIIKNRIEARWNAAASVWDVKALARVYTREALFFGLLPELYVGRLEIERYFSAYKDIIRGVSLDLVEQETRQLAPSVFVAQGFGHIVNYHSDFIVKANRVRTSLVVERVEGQWLICLHHFSHVPQTPS